MEPMEIVLDSSAIIPVITGIIPQKYMVLHSIKNSVIVSPAILSCDVLDGLITMTKENIIGTKEEIFISMQNFRKIPVKTAEVDIEKALEIAWKYEIGVNTAFYLEVAKRLHSLMMSFDADTRKTGRALGILML